MKKRDLLKRCTELFDSLQRANSENEQLSKDILQYRREIVRLNDELRKISREIAVCEEDDDLEAVNDVKKYPYESEDLEYGSKMIGRIVVLAAEYSNRLTSKGDTTYRELVNLILGHTEVQKAAILDIWLSDLPVTEKKARMDKCFEDAVEYFECVMAQKSGIDNEKV